MSIANHVGILEYDTWRYYINQFNCSHFKGIGIEDNYYLFRKIYLNNGDRVTSRKKFWQANFEHPLIHGTDYIISDYILASLSALDLLDFLSRTCCGRREVFPIEVDFR